ncbi:MAG: hypothetical protein SPF87_01240 [Bacilli bacterium]|nr:hypothetical protein [Bacilli bacterium]
MYKFSDNSITFIKKYIIAKDIVKLPLTQDSIDIIIDYIVLNYETSLLDDNGDPIAGFEQLQREGTEVVDEYSLHSDEDFDIDYLNKKLAQ